MDHSPLGRLSAELRNKISQLVLVHDQPLNLADAPQNNSLTKTCRQMRHEISAMFWGSNDFFYELTVRPRWAGGYNSVVDHDGNQRSVRPLRILGSEMLSCMQCLTVTIRGYPGLELRIYGLKTGKARLEKVRNDVPRDKYRKLDMERLPLGFVLQALIDIGLNLLSRAFPNHEVVMVENRD